MEQLPARLEQHPARLEQPPARLEQPLPQLEQPLSPEECINVDEAHATRDRIRQSWIINAGVVCIPR